MMKVAVIGCCCYLMQGQATPLHYAANRGHVESTKLLIDVGCNVNAVDEVSYTLYIDVSNLVHCSAHEHVYRMML